MKRLRNIGEIRGTERKSMEHKKKKKKKKEKKGCTYFLGVEGIYPEDSPSMGKGLSLGFVDLRACVALTSCLAEGRFGGVDNNA